MEPYATFSKNGIIDYHHSDCCDGIMDYLFFIGFVRFIDHYRCSVNNLYTIDETTLRNHGES